MADARFHSLLKVKIDETIQIMRESVSSGACTDFPHYREKVGYINGLMDALKLCDEVEKDSE